MNLSRERKLISLMGLRRYVWLSLGLDKAQDWCERVINCHHNARVLADMEYRLGCVLCEATGGRMSKASYDVDTMCSEIHEHHRRLYDIHIEQAIEDHKVVRVSE